MNKNEIIPKTIIGFNFSNEYIIKSNNSLKLCNLINLVSFEGMFIIETAYSYKKFKDEKTALNEFKAWVKYDNEINKAMEI